MSTSKSRFAFLILVLLAGLTPAAYSAVWYVDKSNTSGVEDGTSWGTAFGRIQDGIDAASDDGGGELWLAVGEYDHISGFPGGEIQLKAGVSLYGGFAGGETARDERDWVANPTVIDGSTARAGAPAYSVIVALPQYGTIDGFTITGGHTQDGNIGGGGLKIEVSDAPVVNCIFSGNMSDIHGGAIFSFGQLSIENCAFTGNSAAEQGGAINAYGLTVIDSTFTGNSAHQGGAINSQRATTIDHCTFTNNTANFVASSGGAIMADNQGPIIVRDSIFRENETDERGGAIYLSVQGQIIRCIFEANSAVGGGAIWKGSTSPLSIGSSTFDRNSAVGLGGVCGGDAHVSVVNSLFIGNSAGTQGGAFYISENDQVDNEFIHSTFFGNTSPEGSSIYYISSDVLRVVNSILWDASSPIELGGPFPTDVSYSIVRGGFEGSMVLDADPLFVSEAFGDFRLTVDSPAVDSGNAGTGVAEDILGILRPQGLGPDMGAYELTSDGSTGGGGGGCFIATAAYGTPLANEIEILRTLRDTHLLNNALGAALTDTYYRLSPPIADAISTNASARSLVRTALTPIVFLTTLLLVHPLATTAAVLALTTALLIARKTSRPRIRR